MRIISKNNGNHVKLGSSQFNYIQMLETKPQIKLTNGAMMIASCKKEVKQSFLEYVMNGFNISLCIGIDFTLSNIEPYKPNSLHYFNSNEPTQYMKVIDSVGSILECYDSDKLITLLGFGANIPGVANVSHCFALNGNIFNPEVFGLKGVTQSYLNALQKIHLSGPTFFAPIIRCIGDMANFYASSGLQNYFVFLLITDGVILDFEETIDEIINASALPLSIIIVGVGKEDFTAMEALDSDEELLRSKRNSTVAKRDIVQFVPYEMFANDPTKLATETLKEVPRQFLEYAALAHLLPTNIQKLVNAPSYFEKKKQEFLAVLGSRISVNDSLMNIVNNGIPIDSIEYAMSIGNFPSYNNPLH